MGFIEVKLLFSCGCGKSGGGVGCRSSVSVRAGSSWDVGTMRFLQLLTVPSIVHQGGATMRKRVWRKFSPFNS